MEKLGQYTVVETLGRGAMGIVYKARVPVIDELVAIKLFSPGPGSSVSDDAGDVDELRHRFEREARILWGLKHRHIIPIRTVERLNGVPYLVMDYCPSNLALELGFDMEATRRRKGPMAEERVAVLVDQILDGLDFAHGQGVVHRDIKPENILLDAAGQAKIADFGIAAVADDTRYTRTGVFMGTLPLSAPEQRLGAKDVDHRADLFSVAILAYMMLTGSHPFDTDGSPPTAERSGLRSGWDAFYLKGRQKDPADRFQSARQMQDALKALLARVDELFDPGQHRDPGAAAPRPEPGPRAQKTGGLFRKLGAVFGGRPDPRPSAAPPGKPAGNMLRSEPVTVEEGQARRVFGLDDDMMPVNYVVNRFKEHGNGTVSDLATGLMWQQAGSAGSLDYSAAAKYVRQLNRQRFAGHGDWRLPTVDELCSLLEPKPQESLYWIASVFEMEQSWCWTADQRSSGSAWYVFFGDGSVDWCLHDLGYYVRAVRPRQ